MIPFIKHFRNDNIIELENRGVAARACGEGVDNTGGTGGRPLWWQNRSTFDCCGATHATKWQRTTHTVSIPTSCFPHYTVNSVRCNLQRNCGKGPQAFLHYFCNCQWISNYSQIVLKKVCPIKRHWSMWLYKNADTIIWLEKTHTHTAWISSEKSLSLSERANFLNITECL